MKTEKFYSFSIGFAGFLIIVTFLIGAWLFILGLRVYEISQSGLWFGIYFMGWLIWYIILSIYYFFKKYRIPFYTILLLITANLFAAFLLTNQTNEITMSQFYSSLIINTLIAVHGIALMITKTSGKGILKEIGIFYIGFGFIMVGLSIWVFHSLTALVDGYGLKATLWGTFFDNFSLILFIIHFVKERKQTEIVNRQQRRLAGHFMAGLFAICLIVLFWFGLKTGKEAAHILSHAEPASDYQKNLAQRFETGVFISGNKKFLKLIH